MRNTSTPMCDAKDCGKDAIAQIEDKEQYLCLTHLERYKREIEAEGGFPQKHLNLLRPCPSCHKCQYNDNLESNGLCYDCAMQSPMPSYLDGYSAVNHPLHYTEHPSGVECITITEHMGFCLGNAIKYIWRADRKGGIEDLEKARWYITREIEKKQKGS